MRVYVFCHSWLSGIQKGIQGAHAVVELANIAKDAAPYIDWAENHKTLIFLEGGNQASLQETREFFNTEGPNPYFTASFHEDEDSMNCSFTAFAVLIPENIYAVIAEYRTTPFGQRSSIFEVFGLNAFDSELVKKIAGSRLAS